MLLLVPDFRAILLHGKLLDLFIRCLGNGIQDYLKIMSIGPEILFCRPYLLGFMIKYKINSSWHWTSGFTFSFMELYYIIIEVLKNGDRVYVT